MPMILDQGSMWWDGATFVAGRTSTGAFHLPRAYTYAASMPSSSGDVLCMPAGKTSMEPARMHWSRLNDERMHWHRYEQRLPYSGKNSEWESPALIQAHLQVTMRAA